MADTASFTASRRLVLQVMGLGAAGFAVGCSPTGSGAAATGPITQEVMGPFVKVGSDNTVTVLIKHIEFGQGVSTGLTTIVAEEIDADWSQMRFEHAPAEVPTYGNLAFGGMVQGTGGSTAIWNSWDELRKAGAAARAMLVQEAAAKWGVDAGAITVAKGVVSSGNRKATFGELAAEAAKAAAPDPATLKLKDPAQFTLIGKEKGPGLVTGRLDGAGKLNGSTQYAMDYHPDGTLTALLARSPKFGGKVASVDDTAAKAVPGVTDVVQISNGVAVVATNFWAAKKGRDALKITWDDTAAETRSTPALMADYKKLLARPGAEARKEGAGAAGLRGPGKQISLDFEFPYLVHAPMEPLNCVVEFTPGTGCKITSGAQMATVDQAVAAQILGLDPKTVTIDIRIAGGSFGRRATPDADLVAEAAQIAKALNGKAPLKLMWTREDDVRAGKYRPMAVHRMSARFQTTTNSQTGKIETWTDRTAIQSIMEGTPFLPPGTPDFSAIEGANDIPYAIPNISVDVHFVKSPITVLWWRAVGHTHTAYAKEHFFDIVAKQAGLDPFAARQALLTSDPRLLGVLNLADEKAGAWDPTPKADGDRRGRGVAVHKSFNSYVAEIAEVTVKANGQYHVDRVVCAVDCGVVINPDIVRAQMEGGIGYGLSAVLGEALTIKDGAPEQSNFFDYNVLRMAQMPKIEVHIMPSAEAPTGVGEPGTPPIGPAVANALFAATGKTFPKLPIGATV